MMVADVPGQDIAAKDSEEASGLNFDLYWHTDATAYLLAYVRPQVLHWNGRSLVSTMLGLEKCRTSGD